MLANTLFNHLGVFFDVFAFFFFFFFFTKSGECFVSYKTALFKAFHFGCVFEAFHDISSRLMVKWGDQPLYLLMQKIGPFRPICLIKTVLFHVYGAFLRPPVCSTSRWHQPHPCSHFGLNDALRWTS